MPATKPEGHDASFPWGPVLALAGIVLVHIAFVLGLVGLHPSTPLFARLGGLVSGPLVVEQPWRLVTHVFLHADPSHVFWNGLSMVIFAVPLIIDLGYPITAAIYLAGGVLGGIAGALGVPDGVVLIGSSGAVAGLFGAWIAITLLRARASPLPRLARIRVVGIALLVLPSFLTPTTSTGEPISVGSHLGGLAAGLAAGILLWSLGYVTVQKQEDEEKVDELDEEV